MNRTMWTSSGVEPASSVEGIISVQQSAFDVGTDSDLTLHWEGTFEAIDDDLMVDVSEASESSLAMMSFLMS